MCFYFVISLYIYHNIALHCLVLSCTACVANKLHHNAFDVYTICFVSLKDVVKSLTTVTSCYWTLIAYTW